MVILYAIEEDKLFENCFRGSKKVVPLPRLCKKKSHLK